MSELTLGVNWLAVGIGTVVSFLLGWLWYSPKLFGKKWAEGSGVNLADANEMPVGALVLQLIATFLLAWLVGITAANNALATCILIIIAIMCFVMTAGMFAKKSTYAIATETSFIIAMGVIMIVVQGIF